MLDEILGAVVGPTLLPARSVASCSASRSQSTAEGCGSHRWTSRWAATATSTRSWSRIEPGRAEHRQPLRQVQLEPVPASSARLGGRRSARPGWARRARSRSRRHSSACQARSAGSGRPSASTSRPRRQLSIMAGRVAPYRAKRSARCRAVDQRRPPRTGSAPEPRSSEIGPQQLRPRLAAAAVDHGQQGPDGTLRLPGVDSSGSPGNTAAQDPGDQPSGRAEFDPGAHAVAAAHAAAELPRQLLGEPALDARAWARRRSRC